MDELCTYQDLRELLVKLQGNMSSSNRYQADNLIAVLDFAAELATGPTYDRQTDILNELHEILS